MRKRFFLLALATTTIGLSPADIRAACIWCFQGQCFNIPNKSCNEMSGSGLGGGDCFTLGPTMFTPSTDHVLVQNGRAWLVQGPKSTPFASDRMMAFLTSMTAMSSRANREDPKARGEVKAAWDSFRARPDDGAVSTDVVSRFAEEMRLVVRRAERRDPR